MFAPPSWGLARQEHARSPPVRHCKWRFLPAFSWKKSAKQSSRQSKPQQNAICSPSKAVSLDLSKKHSCVDLSADAKPNECIGMAPSLSNSSDVDPDNLDSENAEQILSGLEPETNPLTSSSSNPSTRTAPQHGQLGMPSTTPATSISTTYKERIHDLPNPIEAHLCVHRRMKTLEYDEHGEPYLRITRGAINISSLPPEEQNAAYNDVLTKTVPTKAFGSGSADVPGFRGVLEQYSLHLTRLAFIRSSIRDLTLQHRTSGQLSYRYSMSPWDSSVLRGTKKETATAHRINASSAFETRAAQERDERGIMRLLDRCEGILKHDPKFKPVPWRAQSPPPLRKRWKAGRGGWMGLDPDDVVLQIARKVDDERSVEQAKAALKKAFSRAANKAMGKKRSQSGLFLRARTPDSKTDL